MAEVIELAGELNCIFQRQFRARADGKVGGVHRIPHQDHMTAMLVFQPPLIADHALEVQPGRATQVPGIGHERSTLQRIGK